MMWLAILDNSGSFRAGGGGKLQLECQAFRLCLTSPLSRHHTILLYVMKVSKGKEKPVVSAKLSFPRSVYSFP